MLFSADFAVSVYMTQHNQTLYSISQLLSEIGGLAGALYGIFNVLGRYLNKEFMFNKITRTLYYVKSQHNAD